MRSVPVEEASDGQPAGQTMRALFDGLSDGVTVQAPDGRVTYANDAALRALGYATLADLLAATPQDLARRWEVTDERGLPVPFADLPGRHALQGRASERLLRFRVAATGEERWSLVRASPLLDAQGNPAGAVNLFRDVTEERRLHERQALLADAGSLIGRSLDPDGTLAGLTRLVVPRFADASAVHLVRPDGALGPVALAHADPALAAPGRDVDARWPASPDDAFGAAEVVRTGQSHLVRDVTPETLARAARDDAHRDALLAAQTRSLVVVPLKAGGRVLGALALGLVGANPRRFGPEDVAFAEELAARAAVAVENARLYREAEGARGRLAEMVDDVDGVLWEADAETHRFRFVSRRAQDLLGHPTERWTQEAGFWADRLHPLDRARVLQTVTERARAGQDHELEYRMVAADGHVVWVRDVVRVTKDESGRPARLRGLMQDVTARRQGEARLAAQDAVTRALADARDADEAARGIVEAIAASLGWELGALWFALGDALRCAHAWATPTLRAERFLDATRGLSLARGQGLPGTVWQEARPLWMEDFPRQAAAFPRVALAREEGLRAAVGVPVMGAGGARGALEFFARDAREADEGLTALLAGFGQQLGQCLDRLDAEEALRRSNERRGAILDASLDCIVTIDRQGVVVEWNPAAERTFGWTREEALGREMADLIVPAEARDAHRAGMARLSLGGEARILGQRLELTAMRRDGATFPVELAIVALPGGEGQVFTGFLRDITQRRRGEEAILFQRTLLSAQMEAVLDGIVIVDNEHRIVAHNRQLQRLWGIPEGMLEAPDADAVLGFLCGCVADPDALEAGFRRLREDPSTPVKDEVALLDGRVFERYGAAVRDGEGRQHGRVWTFRDASERRRADETLKRLVHELDAQRARLDTIIRSVPGVVWEAWGSPDAAHQRIDFVSDHVTPMLGYTPQEWTSQPNFWLSIVHPEDRERAARESREHFERGQGGTLQFRWRRKDGTYLWVQAWNTVVRDAEGRPVGMRGVTLDVSARRQAEEGLRASEERFGRAFSDASIGMLITGADGRLLDANAAFARMLGRSAEEIKGRSFADLTHPDDRDLSRRMVESLTLGASPSVAFEKRYVHRDGRAVWTHVTSSLVRDEAGRPLHFVTQVQDVTERREAEQAMRESDRRFRLLAKATSDTIWDWDLVTDAVWWNENFVSTFGYGPDEIEPGSASWTSRIHPNDLARVKDGILAAIAGSGNAWHDEYRFRRKDGTWANILDRGFIIRDAAGKGVRMLGSMMDLTDRRRAEAELSRVKRHLEQILESAGEGVYGVDEHGVTTFMNAAALKATGLAAEEAVGRKLHGVIHHSRPDGSPYPAHECPIYQAAHGGPAAHCTDDVFFRKDGTPFPVEYVTTPIREGDRVVGAVTLFKDVTEQRRVQAALRESEERYRLLAEHSKDIITRSNVEGLLRYVSPASRDLLGYEPEELVGRLARELVHPDDMPEIAAKRSLLREGRTQVLTGRFRRKDGVLVWLEVVARPVVDPATGEVRELVSSWRDVTARRDAEAALRESEARYRFMAENSGDMISRHAPDTTYLWVSPAVTRILGYQPEEIVGRRSFEFVHPDDMPVGHDAHGAILELPDAYQLTLRYRHKAGHYVWLEAAAQTVRDPRTGQPVEIVASSRDVTQRKEAEGALARLAAIVEQSTDAVYGKSADGRITDWNPGAERLYGYTREEIVGKPIQTVVPPERIEEEQDILDRVRRGEVVPPFETVRVRKDGARIDVSLTVSPLRDGFGRFVGASAIARDITERKRAEERVRETLARLDLALDAAALGAWDLDLVDDAAVRSLRHDQIFGYPEGVAEWGAQRFLGHVVPEDRAMVQAAFEEAFGEGRLGFECRIRRADGAPAVINAQGVVVRDGGGRPVRMLGVVADVTERRRAEDAIRESEARYRFLAENGRDMITRSSPEGRLLYVSPAVRRLLGYEPEDLLGRVTMGLVHPEDVERVTRERAEIAQQDDARTVTLRFRRKDGEYVWLEAVAQAVHDPKTGQLVELVGASRDVTERKLAEQTLQEQTRTLATLNRINTQLAAELDLDRLVQTVTDAATELTGARFGAFFYNQQDEHGQNYMLYTISGVPREAFSGFPMPRVTEVFGPTFRGEGVVRLDDVTQDPRFGRNPPHHGMPQGHLPVRSYLAVPVASRSGKVIGGLFFGHPEPGVFTPRAEQLAVGIAAQAAITLDNASLYRGAQQRAEELAKLAEALERSNRELDQFAYVTSHDLKAPLRGIANLSRWIEEDMGERVTPETRQHLDLLRGRVVRMEGLIDAILEYSRVGRKKGRVERVGVKTLLHDVVDLLSPPPGFRVNVPDALPVVQTERARLQQVFMNLIGNAVKHHPRKEEGVVDVGVEDLGDRWRFSVKDNGRGIPKRFHEKVFVIFQTLEARDKVEGAGIGLAIVKKVVESKGGRIELDSDEGQGATFRFTWPKDEQGGE